MANITERNGKFHVRVYRKEGAVCKSFHLKKDALAWARRTEADIQAGRWGQAKDCELTLREALSRYSRDVTSAKKGVTQETCVINAIARDPIAARSLTTLKAADMAALRDGWLQTLAPATVRRRLAIISHCFEIARKEWSIDIANPISSIRKPTVFNSRNRRLAQGELEAVLVASKSAELGVVAQIALGTAMRLSEIVALRWEDVNLPKRTLTLRDSKNGTGRVVPLSPVVISEFTRLTRRIDGRVFGTNGPSISQAWARAVERARVAYRMDCIDAGIPPSPTFLDDLHFHDLRHEATSRFFELGVFGTMEVAAITGHKTIQMLARYSHMNVAAMAAKLASAGEKQINN
jgi:integrase